MKTNQRSGAEKAPTKTTKSWRIARTISFSPEQDRYLSETTQDGNVSEYVRQLIDAAREGRVAFGPKTEGESSGVERARAYHRAKEASMAFEEDVFGVVQRGIAGRKSLRVVRNRIHNGDGVFCADVSIEDAEGKVILSIQCKSSPRADRLNLALAEAMIGHQKTGAPVITVTPYLLPGSDEVASRYDMLGYVLVRLSDLLETLDMSLHGV